jgi:hypothetical protein
MTANAIIEPLDYPVLRFVRGMVFPARNVDEITQCSKTALRKGFFRQQLIVDSAGRALKVEGARKLCGIGRFWGYNVFLNQRIKVELVLQESVQHMDPNELRQHVLHALRGRQAWDASADFIEVGAAVGRAHSISEIAKVVTEAYYRKPA